LAVALAAALLIGLNSPAAQAATYDFVGDGVSLDITTGSSDNGGFDITNVAGTVLGYAVTLAGGDPGPGGKISSDDRFIYDNILYPTSNPVFDIDGLLVLFASTDGSGYLYANLWGNGSANSYSLYTSAANGSGYPVASTFATPLPSTWTMLIVGLLGVGCFAYRGTKKNVAAMAAA